MALAMVGDVASGSGSAITQLIKAPFELVNSCERSDEINTEQFIRAHRGGGLNSRFRLGFIDQVGQVALVTSVTIQRDFLISDNIRYGSLHKSVTDDDVRRAAIDANINNFILTLPDVSFYCLFHTFSRNR